jgi:hypothetical protein
MGSCQSKQNPSPTPPIKNPISPIQSPYQSLTPDPTISPTISNDKKPNPSPPLQ